MPGRDKPLITRNGIPDPQAYNPQTGQWESFIGVSWGKTAGGLYVPIRVDDQGRQEVTLSGTIVEEEIIPRAIRNTDAGRVAVNPPVGAYGAIVEHYIHGVTGTFGADEGARLQVALMRLAGGTSGPIQIVTTASKRNPSSASGQAIILYPGVSREEGSVVWFGVSPILPLRIDVLISGKFEQGQGFDSAVNIRWLIGR